MNLPDRPLTVELLIKILEYLPKDTLVWQSTDCSNSPIDRFDLHPQMGPLFVYEKDGEVRLYIDDGEAFHPDIDPYSSSLFWSGDAFKRARKLRKT